MITSESIPALAEAIKPVTRLHLNSPHTFHGEPFASPLANDLKAQMDASEIEEKYYYINNTHKPITIMRRDGLAVTIAHKNSYTSSDFTVRKVIRFRGLALESAIASLHTIEDIDTAELTELKRCLCGLEYGKYTEASVMLDYVITLKDLQAKGGMIYHYQLDLSVSTKDAVHAPPHPYSGRFLRIGGFGETNEYTDQNELNLKIRLVDHSSLAAKKYINIAGKVFSLNAQKDAPYGCITAKINGKRTEKKYSDYLQIFYSAKNDPQVIDNTGVGHMRIALAEAKETMGLYDSYADALNSGNIEASRKEKLTEQLHEVELLRGENTREKARIDKDEMVHKENLARQRQELEVMQSAVQADMALQKQIQARLDVQLQGLENDKRILEIQRKAQDETLDREKKEYTEKLSRIREDQEARIKTEALHWREFYEMRSQVRKDTSDFVRFVPGILIGVAGVAAAWLKFSTPAK